MERATTTYGLLERARGGDRSAFEELFGRYRRRLAVLVHYKLPAGLRGAIDPEDVLQETLLRAFRGLEGFHYTAPGSFQRWLARIADNVVADMGRRRASRKRAAERQESHPPEPIDSRTPSRLLARKEQLAGLLGRLDALPPAYREVILLARMEGLSTGEVAERMGKSREAVSLLLHRALARLRELQEGT
jgi:RNA polymerase sigma-70 factor, ECF subfamily